VTPTSTRPSCRSTFTEARLHWSTSTQGVPGLDQDRRWHLTLR
jgi:hypothetical protein